MSIYVGASGDEVFPKKDEEINLFTDLFFDQYDYPDPVSICTIKKKKSLWKTIFDSVNFINMNIQFLYIR